VLALFLLGGGGAWFARAKLMGALGSSPGVGITASSVTLPEVPVPSAATSVSAPVAASAAPSAVPTATPNGTAWQTNVAGSQSSASPPSSAVAGLGKTPRPPTGGPKNTPPPAGSGKGTEHHQLGGTGLTDSF